jgi:type II secretory pathway component PulJ
MLSKQVEIRSNNFRQGGYPLIEMLVATLVSVVVLAGVMTVVVRVSVAAGETVGATRLNQQSRVSLDQITKDLQRAGYVDWFDPWDDCVDTSTPNALDDINADGAVDILDFYECSLPVIDLIGDIRLFDFPTAGDASSGTPSACTTNCDCILYSYDLNTDGFQGIGAGTAGANQNTANFELFGFRWNNGAAEMRTAGNVHSCNTGTWRDLNDNNVNVSNLGFSMVYATALGAGNDSTMFQLTGDGFWNGNFQSTCTPNDTDGADPIAVAGDTLCVLSRSIDVAMQAQSSLDANVTLSLNTTVKNKNNYLNIP